MASLCLASSSATEYRHLPQACQAHLKTTFDLDTAKVSDDGRFVFLNSESALEVQDSFRNEKLTFHAASFRLLSFQPECLEAGLGLVEQSDKTVALARLHLDFDNQLLKAEPLFSLETNLGGIEVCTLYDSARYWIIAQQFLEQKRCQVYLVDKACGSFSRPAKKVQLQIEADRLDFFTVKGSSLYFFNTHRSPLFHLFPADLRCLWRYDLNTDALEPLDLDSSPDIPTFNQMNGFLRGAWNADQLFVSNGVHSYMTSTDRTLHFGVFSLSTCKWTTLVVDHAPRLLHGMAFNQQTAILFSKCGISGNVNAYRLPMGKPELLMNLCFFAVEKLLPEVHTLSEEELRSKRILPLTFRHVLFPRRAPTPSTA